MFIAAATEVTQRLAHVPTQFWVRVGLGMLLIVTVVVLLRKLAHVNKAILAVVAGIFATVIGFNWIYERNEPTWASPAVSFLAGFFPSKGKLAQR